MIRLDRAVVLAVVVTVCAAAVLVLAPGHAALVAHSWLAAVLALALGVALDRLNRAIPRRPSSFERAFAASPATRARPASLARVEREVTLATGTAFDVHFRLRPIVREVAAGLLLRRGIDLERSPDRARTMLGARVWELARPDRPPPEDRTSPGLPIATVESVVDDLERLACS